MPDGQPITTMPHNEDGEFELILGNKQLLSVFFLVIVLLGVFFAMGYVVGRNSGPVGAVETVQERQPSDVPASKSPVMVESNARPASSASNAPESATAPPRQEPLVITESEPEPTRVPTATQPAARQPQATVQPEPLSQPAAGGLFLQVVASPRPQAEMITELLNKRGFSARVVPGPNDLLFRVWVGPLADNTAVSKSKASLEALGFKPVVKKS